MVPWPLGQVLGNLDFFQSFYSKTLKSMYVLEDDMNEVVVSFVSLSLKTQFLTPH